MTLQDKIRNLQAMLIKMESCRRVEDYTGLQAQATQAKAECQSIKASARAKQKRDCTHANLNSGHRSIRDWNGIRKVTRHFNCTDCGKTNIKVEVISKESVIRGDD